MTDENRVSTSNGPDHLPVPPTRPDQETEKGTRYTVLMSVGPDEWTVLDATTATSHEQAKRQAMASDAGKELAADVLAGTTVGVKLVAVPNFRPTPLGVDPPGPPRIRV